MPDTPPDSLDPTQTAPIGPSHRRRWPLILAVFVVAGVGTIAIIAGTRWLAVRSSPPSVLTVALEAVDDGDLQQVRASFDRLPAGTDVAGFARTLTTRYGAFRDARRTTNWSEPSPRGTSTARFQVTFARATIIIDVTARTLVDEASATGDTSFLGQTRLVQVIVRDAKAGNVTFP